MSDLLTMVWKEWRDALLPAGKIEPLRPIVFIALLGIIWPLITGQGWLTVSTAMALLTGLFPFSFLLNYIGDAFAGERERHTLATLLASRISDRAIFWGKLVANVGYIWGLTLIASLVGVLTVNLGTAQGPWMFYTPVSHWLVVLIFSLLADLLSAGGGILISLHSATVRQAQQTLLLGMLGLWMLVYFVVRALPPQIIQGLSYSELVLVVMLFLAVIDGVLLTISLVSFHRSRLIIS